MSEHKSALSPGTAFTPPLSPWRLRFWWRPIPSGLRSWVWARARTSSWRGSFSIYFLAIVLEATPFILLGAVVSGLMELWLPADLLPRLTARAGPWGILVRRAFGASLSGVRVRGGVRGARSFAKRTTAAACHDLSPGRAHFELHRAGLHLHRVSGLAISPVPGPGRAAGGSFGRVCVQAASSSPKSLLKPEPDAGVFPLAHGPRPAGHEHARQGRVPAWLDGWGRAAGRVTADFVDMMPYFLIGVSIASAMKTFIPASSLAELGQGPVSGPMAMMSSAFVLSLCSEADAFVASSFHRIQLLRRDELFGLWAPCSTSSCS